MLSTPSRKSSLPSWSVRGLFFVVAHFGRTFRLIWSFYFMQFTRYCVCPSAVIPVLSFVSIWPPRFIHRRPRHHSFVLSPVVMFVRLRSFSSLRTLASHRHCLSLNWPYSRFYSASSSRHCFVSRLHSATSGLFGHHCIRLLSFYSCFYSAP